MKTLKKITIIGSGNVATHLAKALYREEYQIDTVYSQTKENAVVLANEVDSFPIDKISQMDVTSDLYLIAIKDDAIADFSQQFPFKDQLVVHTSGSISMEVFKENGFTNYGIFYPLQTFSKDKKIHLDEVPFCIEGSNEKIEADLIHLAKNISSKVYAIDSEERKKIHLAAVFACNFTNYMYTISEDILKKNRIDFDILKPLIQETAKKILKNTPQEMQTGPAVRKDQNIMQDHLDMLSNQKDYQTIYQLISNQIKQGS